MRLTEFLHTPDRWRATATDMHRSTISRVATGKRSPSVDIADSIVTKSGRRTLVTASTLTPLPTPQLPGDPPRSPDQRVPLFERVDNRQLTGDYTRNFIWHHPGQGGTLLLAMLSAVASGGGWDTWAIVPNREMYFSHADRIGVTSDRITDLADEVRTSTTLRQRPLLLSVDRLADLGDAPELIEDLTVIARMGRSKGIFLNVADTTPPPAALSRILRPILFDDAPLSSSISVDGIECQRPSLFVDYLLHGDVDDIDYLRYLHHHNL